MAVIDVVTILTEYCEDGEETFRDLHGPEAVVAVKDTIDLLETQLGNQLEYDTLWEEFEAAPRETTPQLAGALEAMVEADPGLSSQMEILLEEYYATSEPVTQVEGLEVTDQEAAEVVPREEQRIKRHQVEPRNHTDVHGEGTYLYGNVRAGSDLAVEKAVEQEADLLAVHREMEMLSFDVDELFEQLRATVEQEPAFNEETKTELKVELEGLETELMQGEEADEDEIVEHLRRLGDVDPNLLELLLTGLQKTDTEAEATVREAIRRLGGGGESE
jgi:hypothetical protein